MRKQGKKANQDYRRGQAQANANEPQGYDLMDKSSKKMQNLFDQEQKAAKELLNSKQLKGFKEFDVDMHNARLKYGPLSGFKGLKKDPRTGKVMSDAEIDKIGEGIATRNLGNMLETLEKGGKPAKNLKKIASKVVNIYEESGKKIPK